jgi:hypothetical protein
MGCGVSDLLEQRSFAAWHLLLVTSRATKALIPDPLGSNPFLPFCDRAAAMQSMFVKSTVWMNGPEQ